MKLKVYILLIFVSLSLIAGTVYFSLKPVSEPCLPESEAVFENLSTFDYLKALIISYPENVSEECLANLKAGRYYVPARAMNLIQVIMIMPLLYAVYEGYRRRSKNPGLKDILKSEYIRWLAVFISLLSGYLTLKMLPFSVLMANYEIYPSIKKEVILNSPRFLTPLIVILVVFFVFFILRRIFNQYIIPVSWDWEGARFFLLTGLLITSLLAWLTGAAYVASFILFLPLYLWPLLSYGINRNLRYNNLIILTAGPLFLVITLGVFSYYYRVPLVNWWHLLWVSAYGVVGYGIIITVLAYLSLLITGITVARNSSPPETISEAGL